MAYVAPTSRATGYLVPAAVWNQDVVDNVIALRTETLLTQSSVTGSRAIDGTAYQNTSDKTRTVTVEVELKVHGVAATLAGNSGVHAKCDHNAAPALVVAASQIDITLSGLDPASGGTIEDIRSITFMVPKNYYYSVETYVFGHGVTPTLESWMEYDG